MRKRHPFVLGMAVLVVTSLVSCLKTVTNNNTKNPAYLAIVNVAPYAPGFNVTVDTKQVGNNDTFPYASYDSLPTGGLRYDSLYAGIHSISFADSGNATTILAAGLLQFSKNTKYSVYLYDTLDSYGLRAVQLQDSYDSVPLGYAIMRFLNFSPNLPPVDVYLAGQQGQLVDTTPVFQGYPYIGSTNPSTGTLSAYNLTLTPGNYTFWFDSSGASLGSTVLLDTFRVTILPNKAYTMFVTGLVDTAAGMTQLRNGLIKMN